MSRIIKTAKTLRNHWKKSTFFFGVLAYGTSYLTDRYKTFQMMRAYCEEAKKYGELPVSQMMKPKHVTVILNPEANNKKSNVQFEKFAAPLLHLAGLKVSVFQTEKEKQAQDLMRVMSNTDAVIVAGGDGTLQEVVTGLLTRPGVEEEKLPLGIVPLGKTNSVAQYLFGTKSSSHAQLMAEAVMAIIRETTVKMDVFKVQYVDEDKPVFGMVSFEQGIFADVEPVVQKYWYLGALKERFTYFINSLKDWKPIEIAKLGYVAPCSGCSKCYIPPKKRDKPSGRWWESFLRRPQDTVYAGDKEAAQKASTINEDCGHLITLEPEYSNLTVSTVVSDTQKTHKSGSLVVKVFPRNLSISQFITSGLTHRKSKCEDDIGIANVIEAREVVIETTSPVEINYEVMNSTENSTYVATSLETHISAEMNSNPIQMESTHPEENLLLQPVAVKSSDTESAIDSNPIIEEPESSEGAELTNQKDSSSSSDVQKEDKLNLKEKKDDEKNISYIDNEKYPRSSCSISLLPKQVTVYG